MSKKPNEQDTLHLTARRQAATNEILDGQNGLFRSLAKTIPVGILRTDTDGRFKYVNERWCKVAGITLADALGGGWEQAIHTDDRKRVVDAWHTSIKDRQHFFMEYRFRHPNGTTRWVQEEAAPERDTAGQVTGYIGIVTDITQSKQTEDEYHRFFNLIPDLACVASADGYFLKINSMWQETLGYSEQEILSIPFLELIHPDDRDATMEQVKLQLAGNTTLHFTNRYRCKNGGYRWLEWRATPAVDGKLLFASARDITERRMLEQGGQDALERMDKIASQVPGVVYQFRMRPDGSSCVPYASEAAREIYRVDPEEVREDASKIFAYAHPDDLAGFRASILASAEKLAPWQHEYRLKFDDGTVRWVFGNAIPQREADGSTLWHGFLTDITERKQKDERIRQSEEKLNAYLDNISDTIWLIGANLEMAYVSSSVTRLLGVHPEELIGQSSAMVIHPDDMAVVGNAQQYVMAHPGEPHTIQYRIRHRDGRWIHVESTGVNMLDNPVINGVLVTMRDISGRRHAEELLRFHSEILLNLTEGVVLTRAGDGIIVFANPRFEQMFGYDPGGLLGKHVSILNAPSGKSPEELAAAIMSKLALSGKWNGEIQNIRKDGSVFWCHASVSTFDHPQYGRVWVSVHEDITERKLIEDELKVTKERYDFATAVGRVGTWDWNPVSGELAWSDETFRLMGFVPHAIIPSYELFLDLLHPDDRDQLDRAVRASLHEKKPYDIDCRVVLANGDELVCHVAGMVDFDTSGQPVRMLGTIQDITERKRAENSLRQNEASLRAILDNSPYLVWLKDTEGRYITSNRAHASYARQKDAREIAGKTDYDLWPKELAERYCADDAEVIASRRQKHVEEPSFDGNRTHWVETYKTPIIDETGRVIGTTGFARDITERKQAEQALAESESRFREIFNTVNDAIFIHDAETGRILDVNRRMCEMYGVTREEAFSCTADDLGAGVPPYSSAEALEKIQLACTEGPQVFEWLARARDGHYFWVEVSLRFALIGDQRRILAVVRDISERKQVDEELRIAAIAFESQDGVMVTDVNNVILRVNHAFTVITGYTAEEVIGQTPAMLSSDRHDANFYKAMWDDIRRTGAWHGEIWNRRKSGEDYPQQLTITAVKGEDGRVTHYVATLRDITERKVAEEEIYNLAFYDMLTHLPNRRLLDDRLRQAMASSKRSGLYGALMFLDLDNFKPLNDTYGHDVGDLLLVEAARRITVCVREVDTVARFGGDEFVVVLSELKKDQDASVAQASVIANKIRTILSEPYTLKFQGHDQKENIVEHRCTSSIGVALFINHEAGTEDIIKWADIAMYQAKDEGRNRVNFYRK